MITTIEVLEGALFRDLGGWRKQGQLLQLILSNHSLPASGPRSRQSPIVMAVNGLIIMNRHFLGFGRDILELLEGTCKDCEEILGIFKMLFDEGMDVSQSETPGNEPPFHKNHWGLHSIVNACLCLPGYSRKFQVEEAIDFLIERGVSVDARVINTMSTFPASSSLQDKYFLPQDNNIANENLLT